LIDFSKAATAAAVHFYMSNETDMMDLSRYKSMNSLIINLAASKMMEGLLTVVY
jgi:hypothetical protein